MKQRIGDYFLLQPLGQSDFSAVFLGVHHQQATRVAVKVLSGRLNEEDTHVFLENTALLSQLQHPNIIPIQDFGVEDGTAFIVMDYAPQGTLRQRYPRGTGVPLMTIPEYINPIAEALHYLHEQGLVHRDIKPHNILLDSQGKVLLGDFGTAIASYTLHPQQVPLTDFEGTVLYAAPEQLQGRPRRASDQYALGVVVYEWICGHWPFQGNFHEVVHQHLFVSPPSFSEKGMNCPPNIEQVVRRALEKNPGKRFPHIKLFADELAWACKVAHARGDLFVPDTSPLAAPPKTEMHTIPLALPTTPLPLSDVEITPVKPARQFKSPLPFRPKL